MKTRFLAAAVVMFSASAASAQTQNVGVPACDDFLTKYQQCLGGRGPAANREAMTRAITAVRDNWSKVAETPEGRAELVNVCRDTADKLKSQVAALKCEW